MSTAEKYVVAAYLVFLVVLLAYLVIHSLRLAQLQRQVEEIAGLVRDQRPTNERAREAAVG